MVTKLICNVTYLITFLFLNYSAHGEQKDGQIINEIISQQREQINILSSIEYSSKVQSKNEHSLNQTFVYDRGMYKSTLNSSDAPKPLHKTVAYDGTLYQELDATTSTLSVTRKQTKTPYLAMEMLTVSHIFAIPPAAGYDVSIKTLQDSDIWQELTKYATFKEYKEVQGHKCAVLTISWPVPEGVVIYDVAFAKDYDWNPVYVVAKDSAGRIATKMELSTVLVKDASGRNIYMPCLAKISTFTNDGNLSNETALEVLKDTIKINHQVSPEIFTLPRTQADVFVDVDLRASTHIRLDDSISDTPYIPTTSQSSTIKQNKMTDLESISTPQPLKYSSKVGLLGLFDSKTISYTLFIIIAFGCIIMVIVFVKSRYVNKEKEHE